MSGELPRFAHFADKRQYDINVAAGNPLCERCDGSGNELYAMYKRCTDCHGSGVARASAQTNINSAVDGIRR